MKKTINILTVTALLCISGVSSAHHSFAVHFLPDEIVSVTGEVTEYRFTNPHGLVFFTAKDEMGMEEEWRAETNSPNVLRRRGWSRTSIKRGDRVTIEGYPARDGTNYLRIHRVIFSDGRELPGQGRVLPNPDYKD